MNNSQEINTLIFLHIPKTAGSTFHHILEKNYNPENSFTIDGLHPGNSVSEFKELSVDKRSSVDLLKGHMLFGLHKYIPTACTYITFLRDPVERVVSYYYYVCRFPEHYLHDKVVGRKMTLQQFVESGLTTEIYDFQVKLLAGDKSALHSWQYDDSLLELARNNIEQNFSVVGFVEFFDQSLLLMKHNLGWNFDPYYRKLNVTANRAQIDTIGKNIIEFIRKKNALDCTLYNWAMSQFQQQLREAKISKEKVNKFRLLNQLYNMVVLRQLYQIYSKVRGPMKKKN